jgi:hypothetical protein
VLFPLLFLLASDPWYAEGWTVNGSGRLAARLGTPYDATLIEIVDAHDFGDVTTKALRYEVAIERKATSVIVPAAAPRFDYAPTLADVSAALAVLPSGARGWIRTVVVQPTPGRRTTDEIGMVSRAWMTAGRDQTLTVYTLPYRPPILEIAGAFLHEAGHFASFALSVDEWYAWAVAMGHDGGIASYYANTNSGEDFAETYHLFHKHVGTTNEETYRSRMPNRFALLDVILEEETIRALVTAGAPTRAPPPPRRAPAPTRGASAEAPPPRASQP